MDKEAIEKRIKELKESLLHIQASLIATQAAIKENERLLAMLEEEAE